MAKQKDIIGAIVDEKLSQTVGTSSNGLSAYELALQEGFTGTLSEWLVYLKGSDGTQGEQGTQGIQGIQGVPGQDGINGSDATVTKIAVENVLTGEITTHTHAGGSGGLTQAQILTRQL